MAGHYQFNLLFVHWTGRFAPLGLLSRFNSSALQYRLDQPRSAEQIHESLSVEQASDPWVYFILSDFLEDDILLDVFGCVAL